MRYKVAVYDSKGTKLDETETDADGKLLKPLTVPEGGGYIWSIPLDTSAFTRVYGPAIITHAKDSPGSGLSYRGTS